ncbi:hypothetical protein ETAR_06500 [Edwardsiella tarda]|nr:hypothetical protein GBS0709_06450 [Edwardsiella tarda]GAC64548.1 hypothetical protein ET1_12_00720 [Edwardsiella tarda ATCC 15947 = NBRC 105688]
MFDIKVLNTLAGGIKFAGTFVVSVASRINAEVIITKDGLSNLDIKTTGSQITSLKAMDDPAVMATPTNTI